MTLMRNNKKHLLLYKVNHRIIMKDKPSVSQIFIKMITKLKKTK